MDYCRVDLCICGGLTEAKKVAGWCETHYIEQAPHNPLGPGVDRGLPALRPLHARCSPCRSSPGGRRCSTDVVQTDMRLEGGNLYSGGITRPGRRTRRGGGRGLPVPDARPADLAPRGQLGVGLVAALSPSARAARVACGTPGRGARAPAPPPPGPAAGRAGTAGPAARPGSRPGRAARRCRSAARARRPGAARPPGRPATNRSGSANTAGSRSAPDSETVTRSPACDVGSADLDVRGGAAVNDGGGRLQPQ